MSAPRSGGRGEGESPRPPHPERNSLLAGEGAARRESSGSVASPENGLPVPEIGERYRYWCEFCNHEADATYSDKYDNRPQWLIGSAHVDRCPKRDDCLALMAEWLSAHVGREVRAVELKTDPRPFLSCLGDG